MTVMLAPETNAFSAPDPSQLLGRGPVCSTASPGRCSGRPSSGWPRPAKTHSRRVGMTDAVDPAWHAFLLHSREYREFCDVFFGGTWTTCRPPPARP